MSVPLYRTLTQVRMDVLCPLRSGDMSASMTYGTWAKVTRYFFKNVYDADTELSYPIRDFAADDIDRRR